MKFRIIFSVAIVCTLLISASCRRHFVHGRGATSAETRTVTNFRNVEISASVHATITVNPNAPASCELRGYSNLLSHIKTTVEGDNLIISLPQSEYIYTDKDVEATITVPSISELNIKGSADADLKGNITGSSLDITVLGAGDITAENINTTSLSVHISGAGDMKVNSGNVQTVTYIVSGAGDIHAYGLTSQQAQARVSGAGDIQLTAMQKLDVHLSGAGDVDYKGHPSVTSHISGVGSMNDKN